MLLSDTALDWITIVSFLAATATCIRFERLEPSKRSKFKLIIGLPAYDENPSHVTRSLIGLFFSIVCVVSLAGRASFMINVHTNDRLTTVYDNSIGAEVSYYHNGVIFTGGQELDSTNSSLDFAYLAGVLRSEHKLILKKNDTTVEREIDKFELAGDKSGKVTRIDYGKQVQYVRIFGLRFERSTDDSEVKIYLKESDSVSKDRAELNKLLEIKE